MRKPERRALPAVFLSLLLAACAGPQLRQQAQAPERIELADTPFFPQELHQCGPAALATVLNAEGVKLAPEQLVPQVYIPGRAGSLQLELIAATRRNALVPYLLPAQLNALLEQLRNGRPVLLLQNLGLRIAPRWHYAVLIGFDTERNELLLRSGGTRRQVMPLSRFLASWDRAERWAMVVTTPSQIPAEAETARWIAAAAPFESLGQLALAGLAYTAATERWPQSPLGWQALANQRYATGQFIESEAALRVALRLSPDVSTRNNLAQVLLDRGCINQAREQLAAIVDVPAAYVAAVAATRSELDRRAGQTMNPQSCTR